MEVLELVSAASFSPKEEKLPYVKRAIIKLDTAKFLLQVAWETDSLNEKRLVALSQPLVEIGKMLGGWRGQLLRQPPPIPKQNSPSKK